MSLTDAIKEAYADPDLDDDVYDVMVLNHPAWDAPVYLVANVDDDMTFSGITHLAVGIGIQLTGYDDDGQTQGQLRVDNVSGQLMPYLEEAVLAGQAITVTYRAYLASNTASPGEERGGLFLSKVSLSSTVATGTLEGVSKYDTQAFPRLTYDQDHYPGLHGV